MLFDFALPNRVFGKFKRKGLSLKILARMLINEIDQNEILMRSAAVAFYALLAFVPFIAVVLTLSVQILPGLELLSSGPNDIEHQTIKEVESWLLAVSPQAAYDILDAQISRLEAARTGTLLSLGLLASLWVASSLFMSLMSALNRIYGVPETREYWKRRIIAAFMTIFQSVLLLGSLLTIVAWPQIMKLLGLETFAELAITIIHTVGAFLIVLFSFAMIYQIEPRQGQVRAWITPGSVTGSFAFLAITFLFRIYVQNFGSYDKVYGSLGGIVVLILWFWLCAVVLLGSAAIDKIIAMDE
jgi:membrane protein